jgi:Protein of unknown function (DUF3179)
VDLQIESESITDGVGKSPRLRKLVPALSVFAGALAAFILVAYPIYVIRPFREQEPAPLARALWVLLHNKPIVLLMTLVIVCCALVLWRGSGWVARTILGVAVTIGILATAGTWINPYEQMFHPMGDPRFISVNQATIDPNDMVIAVTMNSESHAYPIREMGYHHIVNDRLNGLPMVVTY